MSYARLVLMEASGEASPAWLVVDGASMVVMRGVLTSPAAPLPQQARTILVIPGAEVTTRLISVRAATPAAAAQAAAMMLEDDLAAPRESLHVVLGPARADGRRIACVIAKDRLQVWLDAAKTLGLTPDAVVPDHLMLPQPASGEWLAVRIGDRLAVRGPECAFTAEPELATILVGGEALEPVEDAGAVESLMASMAFVPAANLMQTSAGAQRRAAGGWMGPAVLAALVLISPLILSGARLVRAQMAERGFDTAARAHAAAAVGSTPGDPVAALQARAGQAASGRRFLTASSALFDAVARVQGATLQAFAWQPDGTMRVTLIHDNETDAATLGQAMKAAGYAVREDGSSQAGGHIASDLTLRPAP